METSKKSYTDTVTVTFVYGTAFIEKVRNKNSAYMQCAC